MQKLFVFVGKNKDANGECRHAIAEVAEQAGGQMVDDARNADVIVALGGDGTIMRAAHLAYDREIPVIGINLGRVGYMAELDKSEIPLIKKYFAGQYRLDSRMMLDVTVGKNTYHALNDAVFHSQNRHMCRYSLSCDGSEVNEYRGDGLILGTPTGSTAYSMAAGGSVIDPRLECISTTPICPQSLVAKPMIFAPDSVLEVRAIGEQCMLTVDGKTPLPLEENITVTVKKSAKKLKMIRFKEDGFYKVLRSKTV